MDLSLLESKYLITILSFISGIIITVIAIKIHNKRGLLTYSVHHNNIGSSIDDAIFGAVRVTWNDNVIARLYFSTIELINSSMTDFESVQLKLFTSNTLLLSEKTEIVGTIETLKFSEKYLKNLKIPKGKKVTKSQLDLYASQREYMIPVLNRGQVIKINILNSAISEELPAIWLDIIHKGVKLKFREPQNMIFGLSQKSASIAGTILGLISLSFIITFAKNIILASISAFFLGWSAILLGALLFKAWYQIRQWIAG